MTTFAHDAADKLKIIGKVVVDDHAYTAIRLNDKDIMEINGHKFLLLAPEQVETWRMMLEYWDEQNHALLDRRSTQTKKMLAMNLSDDE